MRFPNQWTQAILPARARSRRTPVIRLLPTAVCHSSLQLREGSNIYIENHLVHQGALIYVTAAVSSLQRVVAILTSPRPSTLKRRCSWSPRPQSLLLVLIPLLAANSCHLIPETVGSYFLLISNRRGYLVHKDFVANPDHQHQLQSCIPLHLLTLAPALPESKFCNKSSRIDICLKWSPVIVGLSHQYVDDGSAQCWQDRVGDDWLCNLCLEFITASFITAPLSNRVLKVMDTASGCFSVVSRREKSACPLE